jgi:predicted nucleotidyltransferase
MDARIEELVNQIKDFLIRMYGKKIKKFILYDSYMRGEVNKDSDIDILVLVDETLNPFEVRKKLSDLLFDIILEKGEIISVIVLPEFLFENYNYPFILNVKKEGLSV